MKNILTAGIDIGGTKILAVILDGGTKILGADKEPTGIEKRDRPMGDLTDSIERALNHALKKANVKRPALKAIGIGCAGQIELSTGDVLYSPHMPWDRIPMKRMMEKRAGLPVTVLNDVQSAAWGEFTNGAGKGSRNMICIFVGTGIGSGIVIEGKLYIGAAGCAGEVGHSSYRVGGVLCECGQRGCAEAYMGGANLWLRSRNAIKKGVKTKIADMIDDLDHIPADIIYKVAQAGDKFAKHLWRDAELALGTILHNYVNLLNPEILVLGGGIVEGLPYLRKFARDYIDKRAVVPAARSVKVVAPALGPKSAAVGAGNMAFINL